MHFECAGKPREKRDESAEMACRNGVDYVQWMNYLGAIPAELLDTGFGAILPLILDGNKREILWVTGQ
jgi:hypothetical protein